MIDWRGIAMAVAQLKQLSEPSKLELMETEYELKAIEKEKDRAFNKASKQFDFYQEKHISTQNQIRAAEDAIRAMSVRGLALPKEHQSKDMADLVADNDTRYVDTLYDLNRDIEASIATDLDYLQELTLIRNNMQFGKELRMSQGAGTEVEYYQDEISKETLTREQWNGMNNTEKKQYIEHYKTSVGKNSAHEYVQTFTPTLMDDPNKYQMDSAYDPLNPHVKLSDSKTTQNVIQTWNASDGSVLYEARSANNRHYTQEQLREQFLDESSSPTSTSQEGLRDFHELERKGGYGQSRRYMTVDKMDEYFNKYQMKELEFDYDSKLMTGWDIDDDGTISHKEFEEAERATIKLMEENGQDVRGIKEGFWSGYESRTEIEAKNLQTKKDQLAFATAELDYKITEQQWNQANISTQDQTRLDAEKELLAIQEYRELSQLVKGVTTYNEKKGKEEYDKEKGKETGISFSRWKSAKEKIDAALEDISPRFMMAISDNTFLDNEDNTSPTIGFDKDLEKILQRFEMQISIDPVTNMNLQMELKENFDWVVNNTNNYMNRQLSQNDRDKFEESVKGFRTYFPDHFAKFDQSAIYKIMQAAWN